MFWNNSKHKKTKFLSACWRAYIAATFEHIQTEVTANKLKMDNSVPISKWLKKSFHKRRERTNNGRDGKKTKNKASEIHVNEC